MARSAPNPFAVPPGDTMHFDDRLATVLRLRSDSPAIARIQYRQLVDLLGSLPDGEESADSSATLEAAHARLVELGSRVPADVRTRMLQDSGLRLRNPRLVALLAQDEPAIASAAIRLARLDETQWLDLAPALPLHARGAMRARQDLGPMVEARMAHLGIGDRALPPVEGLAAAPTAKASGRPRRADPASSPSGIGDLVRRIEAYRKARPPQGEPLAASADSPRLPLGDAHPGESTEGPRAIDFHTDPEGRITWASPPFAPLATGLRLLGAEPGGAVETRAEVRLGLRRRLPIRGESISIAGAPALSGTWQLDAIPRFDPIGGRYTGYAGRLRRPPAEHTVVPPVAAPEGERVRQLLHELRTPVNAIQGFAEVIQQQLFGPTPHEYRAHAAAIAGDAARILAAFEDLERLARLDTGVLALEPGTCDLGEVIRQTVERLEAFTAARGSGFKLLAEDAPLLVAIDRADAERLSWRLLATLAACAAPGEMLELKARRREGQARLSIHLPAALASTQDDDLFCASAPAGAPALSAGAFGTGFALRLCRAEARSAGGRLKRRGERLRLALPGLTTKAAQPSQEAQDTN